MPSCCISKEVPFHIPGYTGLVPGLKYEQGHTFSHATQNLLSNQSCLGNNKGLPGKSTSKYNNPCRSHEKELRARFHMLQGEIDHNPCTSDGKQNVFCVQKGGNLCAKKLGRMNQHGYLSRLSVYESPDLNVMACRAGNTTPCLGREAQGKPFWKEFEQMTDVDLFQEFSPECRHVRLPKLRPHKNSCWDEDMYIPEECLCDYAKLGVIRKPQICECLPLDPIKPDSAVKYSHTKSDVRKFSRPYFSDPTNPYRYFKSGFTGHVPTEKFRNGDSYAESTRKALNVFTTNYLFPHLGQNCPVYLDPEMYCDGTDEFEKVCIRRKSYDGHFHEKEIRDRLKTEFDPKNCPREPVNEPYPLCITKNC